MQDCLLIFVSVIIPVCIKLINNGHISWPYLNTLFFPQKCHHWLLFLRAKWLRITVTLLVVFICYYATYLFSKPSTYSFFFRLLSCAESLEKKNTPSLILVYFILQPLLNLLSCLSCGCARTRIRVRHVPTGVEYSGQTDKKLIRIGKQE